MIAYSQVKWISILEEDAILILREVSNNLLFSPKHMPTRDGNRLSAIANHSSLAVHSDPLKCCAIKYSGHPKLGYVFNKNLLNAAVSRQ